MYKQSIFRALGMATLLLASYGSSRAATLGFTVDTSNLTSGTFALQFQLTNGNAGGVNTVSLSNFNFGGGSAAGGATLQGGASGSLASGVTLVDNAGFLSLFTQGFAPGNSLSFTLNSTENFTGGAPDFFGMAILFNGNPLLTAGPANQLIAVNLQNPLAVTTFATTFSRTSPSVAAPTFENGGTGVPEPSTYLTMLAPLAWLVYRRKAQKGGRDAH